MNKTKLYVYFLVGLSRTGLPKVQGWIGYSIFSRFRRWNNGPRWYAVPGLPGRHGVQWSSISRRRSTRLVHSIINRSPMIGFYTRHYNTRPNNDVIIIISRLSTSTSTILIKTSIISITDESSNWSNELNSLQMIEVS